MGPTVQVWNVFHIRGSQKMSKFWRINLVSRKRNQNVAHDGQRGQKRVPRRFQLKTTRMEGENTTFSLIPYLGKSGMFCTSNITKNLQILVNNSNFLRKRTKMLHMTGKGVKKKFPRRFQLKTTRMEGGNTIKFSLMGPTVQVWNVFHIRGITNKSLNFGD